MSWEFNNPRDTHSIRNGFNSFMKDTGHWVVVVNFDQRFVCDCETQPCTRCLGAGFPATTKYTPVRITQASDQLRSGERTELGRVDSNDLILYAAREVYLGVGDMILDVEWSIVPSKLSTSFGYPTHIYDMYKIKDIYIPKQTQVAYIKANLETANNLREQFNRDFLTTIRSTVKIIPSYE